MCSYNRINLVWACENNQTLNTELKGYFNFSGWVMSDWGATHSTVPSALAGLDQEMPLAQYFTEELLAQAIDAGQISNATIDDKVYRILNAMFAIGLFDNPNTGDITNNVTSVAHNDLARSLAAEATVLLTNNGILPLDSATVGKIAVIGSGGYSDVITGGGGSGAVAPYYQVSPLEGICNRLGGYLPQRAANCTVENDVYIGQINAKTNGGTGPDDCCAQCATYGACVAYSYKAGTCTFITNPEIRVSLAGYTSGYCLSPMPEPQDCNVVYYDGADLATSAQVAANADLAIVIMATFSSEGHDRPDLAFPGNQDAVAFEVAAVQPNTIVVCINPSAVLTPWSDEVGAVLAMFMPGQEEGNALADVLFGDVEPGGRLPITFPNVENEVQFTKEQWPGLPEDHPLNSEYSEMLEIGYRWYQSHGVIPKFAFGHGLSYTTFEYSDLVVAGRNVSFTVTNTGSRAGYEVPQMYLAFPASAGEPPLQLKGFTKVSLAPGQTAPVVFTVTDRDLAIWDVSANAFVAQSGVFGVSVGASSQNILLTGSLVN